MKAFQNINKIRSSVLTFLMLMSHLLIIMSAFFPCSNFHFSSSSNISSGGCSGGGGGSSSSSSSSSRSNSSSRKYFPQLFTDHLSNTFTKKLLVPLLTVRD